MPLNPAALLQLQRSLGNRATERILTARGAAHPTAGPIQRMIEIGATLYYSGAAIKGQLPGKKDKDIELGQWEHNLKDTTGQEAEAVENAYAIPDMDVTGTEGDALNGKLNNGARIFHYDSAWAMNNFLNTLRSGQPEEVRPMLRPKDMLDEKRDLTMKYDKGKACVLQALINLEIQHPGLESAEQDDPEAWHKYYVSRNIMYDDDTVLYKIYTGFGLRLVWNDPTPWSGLPSAAIPPGSYVFNSPGHNFAVFVHDKQNAAERYDPKDKPQNIVSEYQPDRRINYIWRYS
jgi:hypothetical protein